jgi:cell division protein FtsB
VRDKVRRRKLATQILTSQLTILIFTVVLGFALVISKEGRQLDREYQQRSLATLHEGRKG